MTEFPELRSALLAAAERQRQTATARPAEDEPVSPRLGSSHRAWRPLKARAVVIWLAALLGMTAVALAAAGVFSPGRPVTPVVTPLPHADNGAVIPSSVSLLKVRAADPGGGLDWGLRLVRTTRGEVCIAPGRVHADVIGVLGQNRAFGDDGRLHPFAGDYIDPFGCALPDGRGHAFLSIGAIGLPASALISGIAARAGGCRVNNPPPTNRALLCPAGSLRDLYYGLLGPDAQSISYRTPAGKLATEPTTGPNGGYLIVLPYTAGLQGTATIGVGLSGGPILTVHYRDGHSCSTAQNHACQPVGYDPRRTTRGTAAEVRAPIRVRVVPARHYCNSSRSGSVTPCDSRVLRGSSRIAGAPFVLVNISFTARVPVTSSHSYYELELTYAKSHGCTVGGISGPTSADIHAGQRVHMQDFHPLRCPGPIHGAVRYVHATSLIAPTLPGSPQPTSVLVGRFTINPTAPRRGSP